MCKLQGKLSSFYSLYGHRDVANKECPGQALYDEIGSWPGFHRERVDVWKRRQLLLFVISAYSSRHVCSERNHKRY